MMDALHSWLRRLAGSPSAERWLFVVAFVEASCFPLPPDPLLIALCVGSPVRALRFAGICTAGSFAGAAGGYALGALLFDAWGPGLLAASGAGEKLNLILAVYRVHALPAIILAGFTPIPFSLFTLAAGWKSTVGLSVFVPAVIIGRTLRFFLVGGILKYLAPAQQASWPAWFRSITVVVTVLVVAGFFTVRWLF